MDLPGCVPRGATHANQPSAAAVKRFDPFACYARVSEANSHGCFPAFARALDIRARSTRPQTLQAVRVGTQSRGFPAVAGAAASL